MAPSRKKTNLKIYLIKSLWACSLLVHYVIHMHVQDCRHASTRERPSTARMCDPVHALERIKILFGSKFLFILRYIWIIMIHRYLGYPYRARQELL